MYMYNLDKISLFIARIGSVGYMLQLNEQPAIVNWGIGSFYRGNLSSLYDPVSQRNFFQREAMHILNCQEKLLYEGWIQ